MAISTQVQATTPHKIYATIPDRNLDRRALMQTLRGLVSRGSFTERDERVLEYLRELYVLSLDHVQRLLWPGAKRVTAYNRLHHLQKHHLVGGARVPRAGMAEWGLVVCKVYTLGEGGRLWLKEEVDNRWAAHLRRDQVLHDLLVAEVVVRLTEAAHRRGAAWSTSWAGERAASFYERQGNKPIASPDGLAIIRQTRGGKSAAMPLFVELDASREAHGRPSSDWGRKIIGYDRFCDGNKWKMHPELGSLPSFPVVAVVTHGEQRLLNLAGAIREHRKQPVAYYLALWDDLAPRGEDGAALDADILTAPAWLVVTADGQVVGEDRDQRQPLLNEPRPRKRGRQK
jgi:hypothetical protein